LAMFRPKMDEVSQISRGNNLYEQRNHIFYCCFPVDLYFKRKIKEIKTTKEETKIYHVTGRFH
jgi:hypothetical protein